MNEIFIPVDIKQKKTKENKDYFYLICYSTLEYLIKVFLNREQYIELVQMKNLKDFDVSRIEKRYNQFNNSFSYSLK